MSLTRTTSSHKPNPAASTAMGSSMRPIFWKALMRCAARNRKARAPQIKELVVEPKTRDLVERRERLIQQHNIRIGDERARQRDPHLHAAGQFTGVGIGKFGKAYLRQRLLNAAVGVGRRRV